MIDCKELLGLRNPRKRGIGLRLITVATIFASLLQGSFHTLEAAPKGFAVLGSYLPENSKFWVDVNEVIRANRLKEYIPDELRSKEKLRVTIDQQDKERGYIVFSRHYLDPVYKFSLPNNRAEKLSMFATVGEYEPTSFSVYALQDTELKVSVSDLAGEKGVIKKDNLDIRSVTPFPFVWKDGYWMEPKFLEKRKSVKIPASSAKQFWVTVYIPKKTKPGRYQGKIKIESAGQKWYEIDLSLDVLPIKLMEPDVFYGMCFMIPGRSDLHPENLDKYFADMKEHGLNSMWTWPAVGIEEKDGKISCDFSVQKNKPHGAHSLDQLVAGYRRAGFRNYWICDSMDPLGGNITTTLGYKPYTPEFDRTYTACVEQILERAKQKGWPPFCLKLTDEPGGQGREEAMKYAKYYYSLVHEKFPQVKTFANVGPWTGEDVILAPYVDILGYNIASQDTVDKCKKWRKEYWLVNEGSWGRDAKLDRLSWGLFVRKNSAGAMFHWVYTWWWEMQLPQPGKYLHPGFMYTVPAPDGPVPTIAWEGVREGIDDMRYICTLSELIKRAKSSRKPGLAEAAIEADAVLNRIMADVPIYFHDRGPHLEKTASKDFDAHRQEIAREIMKLSEVLAQRGR